MSLDFHFYAHEPAGVRKQKLIARTLGAETARLHQAGLRILDVGCGNGHLSAFMASLGSNVLGIDLEKEAVESAAAQYKNLNVTYRVAGVESISEQFDVITAFEVCEHVPDVANFLRLLKQRLVPGGLLLLSVPNGWSLEEIIRRFVQHTHFGQKLKHWLRKSRALPKCSAQSHADSPHVHFWGAFHWRKVFVAAGFKLENLWNVSLFFKQWYYLGMRRFIKPGSGAFKALDSFDSKLVSIIPKCCADGWVMTFRN